MFSYPITLKSQCFCRFRQPHRVFEVKLIGDQEDHEIVQNLIMSDSQTEFVPPDEHEEREDGQILFTFTGDDREASIFLGKLVSNNVPIISFAEKEGDLEDVFLKVTQGIVN